MNKLNKWFRLNKLIRGTVIPNKGTVIINGDMYVDGVRIGQHAKATEHRTLAL